MKNLFLLLTTAAAAGLLLVCPQPAPAYIDFLPPTLGDLCRQATHIYVVKVDKVNAERGVILFKPAEQLKGKDAVPLPDDTFGKQIIGSDVPGAKVILDVAAEGKTAVVFAREGGFKSLAHVYIDNCWYLIAWNRDGKCWFAWNGEPTMLIRYCGTADKLRDAVKSILKGEEVVVSAMASDDRKALMERRGKVLEVRASLKILGNFKENIDAELLAGFADGKKPDAKPGAGDKKPDLQPQLVGTIKALSADGKNLTVQPVATEKNKQPVAVEIQLTDKTKVVTNPGGKLAVGEVVSVWLDKNDPRTALAVQLGKQPEKPKPEAGVKPVEKTPAQVGTVKAVAADGKSFTLLLLAEQNKEPTKIEVQITERTKITDGKKEAKLAVGEVASVWFEKGEAKVAAVVQLGKPIEKPKPDAGVKPGKPNPDEKPEAPRKPKPPAGPVRDPKPTATVIDTEIDKTLSALKITGAAQADDAEFLRRVYLDLTGRIPTYQQTVAFLDSKEPDKRRKLIDELLDSPEYGQHFATGWRNLLPRELNVNGKGGVQSDAFSPWLAEQFNDNRGWNAIVTDLLTAEGSPRDNPATAFLLANGESGQPRANKAAGAAAGLFLGVNLRCAECHNHPFAQWKQTDFWGTAAFFGKLQSGGGGGKEGPSGLMESLSGGGAGKEKGQSGPMLRGTAIVIPASSGKAAGQAVKARFLGGAEPTLDEKEPFRPIFAKWATSADNPYFAKAAVNRMWAHFFGRGFVNPLDSFDTNSPSHPELLDRLAKEFAASGFDLKHLARCITTSKAYQRSSRRAEGDKADPAAFSHMAVKVLTPEALFDSLEVIGKSSGNTNTGKGKGEKQESREQFLRSFRTDEEATATEYIQGIPELLRLLNASTPNRGAAVVDRLVSAKASHAEAVTTLYLTVLSRRPTDDEVKLMESYLSKRKDDREGYRGVLWILLNTSEFALNH